MIRSQLVMCFRATATILNEWLRSIVLMPSTNQLRSMKSRYHRIKKTLRLYGHHLLKQKSHGSGSRFSAEARVEDLVVSALTSQYKLITDVPSSIDCEHVSSFHGMIWRKAPNRLGG
jgi:hypothetical protein